MDAVTRWLHGQGIVPEGKSFLGSDYFLGYHFSTKYFNLTYRKEGERFLLCDFSATAEHAQATRSLISLLRRMLAGVPAIRHVDALILPASEDKALDMQRRRLVDAMVGEGARSVLIEGDLWLRYSCS